MKDLKRIYSLLFKKSWPLLLIIFIVSIFFWKVFLKGFVPIPADFVVGVYYPWLDYKWGFTTGVPVKNPITTDVVSFTYPMQTLAIDLIKKGTLPLWNPYILAGTPLLANFQSAPFSITNIFYFIFDRLTAWSVQIIFQHILAAFFTYLLLRHWKVSKFGSIFGGIIYAFSGFNLIWSQWNGHTLAASFIPLIILFVDKWLTSGQFIFGIGISVPLLLLFLSGYPQIALYLFLAIGILWLLRIASIKRKIFISIFLGIFLVIGIGLSAFQILPGAELLSLSQRELEPHPFEWTFLPFEKVMTFIAPDYFGNHSTQNYWGPQDYTSNTGFVGVIAMIFAAGSIFLFRKRKEIQFAFLTLLASLVFAFPTPVSVFLWKSGFLGFNAASAHRSLILFNLGIALLAGFGADRFLKEKMDIKKVLILPFILLTGFGGYALIFFLLNKMNPSLYSPLIKNIPAYYVALRNLILPVLVFILAALGLYISQRAGREVKKFILIFLVTLSIFEMFRFGWKFTPFSPREIVFPTTPVLDYLISQKKPVRVTGSKVIPINLRMPYGLESLEGYDAVYPLRISQTLAALNSGRSEKDPVGRYGTVDNLDSRFLDLTGIKYFLVIKRDDKKNPSPTGEIPLEFLTNRFKLAYEDKSVAVLENKQVLPRAFMVYDWEVINKDTAILDELLNMNFPLDKKIILEEPVMINRLTDTNKVGASVQYTKYEEEESILNVQSENEGMLFVSDTFYPGWQAYVDGAKTEIYRADFAFRAIPVGPGSHEVRFVYSPDSFYNGVKISLLSFVALFLIGGGTYLVGKGKEGDYTSSCS